MNKETPMRRTNHTLSGRPQEAPHPGSGHLLDPELWCLLRIGALLVFSPLNPAVPLFLPTISHGTHYPTS